MDKYIELKRRFEENKDDNNAIQMSKYRRDQFKFYGIKAIKRKKIYKDLIRKEKENKEIDWKLLDICFEDEHREFQYFVVDYLINLKKYLTFEDIPNLSKYIKEKQWWDTIDALSKVFGYITILDCRGDDLMLKWSKNEDFWIRRVAILHQLGRKNKTNIKLLEKILINNFGSSEFFINKAIGWILRDYSKTNPDWVKNFIEENKDEMDKLSIREASKYI